MPVQFEKLHKTILRAYNKTFFYNERLKEVNQTPDSIKNMTEFKSIPFTTVQDLLQNYPYGLLTMPISGVVKFDTFVTPDEKRYGLGYTKNDVINQSESLAQIFYSCNINMGSIVLLAVDNPTHYELQAALHALGATVISCSTDDIKNQLQLIIELNVTAMVSTPVVLSALHKAIEFLEFDLNELPLNRLFAVCSASGEAEQVKKLFPIPVHHIYDSLYLGCSIAGECHAARGLHVSEDIFYPEIIDPTTGDCLPDGETGELVITTLTHEAMPILRFRTGTNAILEPGICSCGRNSARLILK